MTDTTPQAEKKTAKKKSSLTPGKILGLSLLAVFAIAWLFTYVVVDGQAQRLSRSPLVLGAAKVFRIPAAEINDNNILYSDFMRDITSLERFFSQEAANDPNTTVPPFAQLSDMTISRLLAAALIEEVADELGVKVTKKDIQEKKQELIAQEELGEEGVEKKIQETYGWNLDQYMRHVVVPIIREEKVSEAFQDNEVIDSESKEEVRASHILFRFEEGGENGEDELVKAEAQKVLDRVKAGENFAELAKEFGSDATAEVGGDLGWFGRGVMVPEFEIAAFALDAGAVSEELVKTVFGYHIVRVEEKREAKDFLAYMDQLFRNSEVEMHIPINNPFAAAEEMGDTEGK